MFRTQPMETVTGVLTKIRYRKDNGWGIYVVRYKDDHGNKIDFTFTGTLPHASIGSSYTFEGWFEDDPKWGQQFKFSASTEIEEETADGAYALLNSNRFPGVGPKQAQAIVKRFGADTLKIIRDNPKALTSIPGIGEKKARMIHSLMPDIDVWVQLRMLLKTPTDNAIGKIYDKYGNRSIEVVKEDPYTLIKDVDGFGFAKADAVAANLGITGAHPLRVRAAVYHCLNSASEQDGHCFSYAPNLQVLVEELIPGVGLEAIADAIKDLTDRSFGKMQLQVDPDGAIYLTSLWKAETVCASVVNEMCALPMSKTFTAAMVEDAANDIMHETGIELEESQKDAVLAALNYPLCTITGGPGTGKTTIIRTILRTIQRHDKLGKVSVGLMAPTGRASRRMAEATSCDARTIHSYLCINDDDTEGRYSRNNPLPFSYVILDESSMIDIRLAARLLKSIDPHRTHIIFIGDADQLPPVGPGVFFLDLIKSYKVPTARLKFSFRQSGSIAQNANKINNGMGTHSFVQDEQFVYTSADKNDAPEQGIEAYLSMVKKYGIEDTVLLSPKKVGNCGTVLLNKAIQERMNPGVTKENGVATFDYIIGVGDRVMLTKNNVVKEHANGDVGTVQSIANGEATILFDNGDAVTVDKNLIHNNFILAYASTIHKSQGSEYAGVVMLFTTEHSFMGERALVYTGETRAKEMFHLIGDARAINRAINIVKPVQRNSKLRERINT